MVGLPAAKIMWYGCFFKDKNKNRQKINKKDNSCGVVGLPAGELIGYVLVWACVCWYVCMYVCM